MARSRKLFIGALLLILAVSLTCLVCSYFVDLETRSQNRYLAEQLQSQISEPLLLASAPPKAEEALLEPTDPIMLEKLHSLYVQNPDIMGWIKIEDTQIDYPVMNTPDDPEFYLSHDFEKQPNKNGLPFLDERSDPDSDFLLIHGHNMKSGLMFSDLLLYKEESYYQMHSVLRFDTLYEQSEYEIVAVILARALYKKEVGFRYYETKHITSSNASDEYMQEIRAMALYETDARASFGDQLIILSTCEYSQENGRLAVIARKK